MRVPHYYGYINLHCKCENEKKTFPDLFVFFQQGEISRGTDHFPSSEKIKKEQMFRGTDHRVRLIDCNKNNHDKYMHIHIIIS